MKCGEVTASTLAKNPDLHMDFPYLPTGVVCSSVWESLGDGDLTANTFTVMMVKVIRKVPGFGGTIANPWQEVRTGTCQCLDEQSSAELVGAWSRAGPGMAAGEDLAPTVSPAPQPPSSTPACCPQPCTGSPACLWMKDELLAQLPPGRGTLPVHPTCFYLQIFQL